jgi:transcription-repair coupling factor (superfamily II helicase)
MDFNIDPRRPLLTPAEVFTPVETLYSDMKRFPVLELRRHSDAPVHVATPSLPPPQLDSDTGKLELARGSTASSRVIAARSCSAPNPRDAARSSSRACSEPPPQFDCWRDFVDSGARVCTRRRTASIAD